MAFVDRLKSPNKTRRIRELLTKISALETNIFSLKMMMKSGLEFFYFEILLAPSEISANLPGQLSPSWQIFWHWAAATLKELGQFQNKI